jgi:ribosomal subunit interface protein
MDVFVTGRGVQITDRFRDYATERADRLDPLAPKAIALEVKTARHADSRGAVASDDRVEITLICPGPPVRAEAIASDKYVAYDLALDKLVERLRAAKDRKKVHRGRHRPMSLSEAAGTDFDRLDVTPASADVIERVTTGQVPVQAAEDDEVYTPVVIRQKVFVSEHMTADEAVDRMELVGHDFFLFVDSTTDRPSVVYRRKGWDYGVIGLEEQQAAVATGGRRG